MRFCATLLALLLTACSAQPQPYGSAAGDNQYGQGSAGMLFRF